MRSFLYNTLLDGIFTSCIPCYRPIVFKFNETHIHCLMDKYTTKPGDINVITIWQLFLKTNKNEVLNWMFWYKYITVSKRIWWISRVQISDCGFNQRWIHHGHPISSIASVWIGTVSHLDCSRTRQGCTSQCPQNACSLRPSFEHSLVSCLTDLWIESQWVHAMQS